MENSTVSGLRSRSRSKTPFLRSSCDHEHCPGGEEHTLHKSGRKTPIKRSTPIKQLRESTKAARTPILEEEEHETSAAARTRHATKMTKTSDYSSEESLDRLKGSRKEILQNEVNSHYERISTSNRSSQQYSTFADVSLSPINTHHGAQYDRSSRYSSPSYSGCSTDSSFAEQALADASVILERDSSTEHLPYRLYKLAGEYWNKYPKTDYTYSPLSKDRVELAPGQVAVPNMSRRSLSQFRIQGPNTSPEELQRLASISASTARKRFTSADSSDDESYMRPNGGYMRSHLAVDERWWITRLLISIVTTITSTVSTAASAASDGYRSVFGPTHRYPYRQESVTSRAASAAVAPLVWIYTMIKKVVTTTVTTVTETITPNHVSASEQIRARYSEKAEKRRWWPWLLLLLLPLVGYGCYCCADQILPQQPPIDTYKSPVIVQDSDLSKRMEALESWAVNVDSKLKHFDQKLLKLDNLEAQIEQYSLKYLQNNLIQIFNMDQNSDSIALKLKEFFDQHYMSKEQTQKLSTEIHERLISSWKPDLDEDRIKQLIQQYLSVFERRQMELILERVREYVKEIEIRHVNTGFDAEAVKRIVTGMLNVYDADKTGLVDYAMESAGGQVISIKCTELYKIKTKQYSILGLPVWWVYTSPRHALTPGAMPAECWAFQGFPGFLVIRLSTVIEVTGFSVEHMSRLLAADGRIDSAPKNFSVYGLHGELDPEPHLFGEYMYDANGTAIQYFPVQNPKTVDIGGVLYPVAYDIIELRILSNHGNPTYTCVYRFRVHGNPLSDLRKATEDSIRDSES